MNNNLKEDYCSLAVSKLLKEKGFDVECRYFYYDLEDGHRLNGIPHEHKSVYCNGILLEKQNVGYFNTPRHSLAIKWILENFDIDIHSRRQYFTPLNEKDFNYKWKAMIDLSSAMGSTYSNSLLTTFETQREAIEAALLYTLTHLIK